MSGVTFQVSCFFCVFLCVFFGQRGEASRWRVCYQHGQPRLVLEDPWLDRLLFGSSLQTFTNEVPFTAVYKVPLTVFTPEQI